MKVLRASLAITLIVWAISVVTLSQKAYSADLGKSNAVGIKHESSEVHKVESEIDADRDKIIEEGKAIKADRRKLKEADKMPDKLTAKEIKEKINQEIEEGEAAIRDLKKEISDKKEERYYLINGKQKDESRRTREGLK